MPFPTRSRRTGAVAASLLLPVLLTACSKGRDDKPGGTADGKPGSVRAALAELPVKKAASKDGYDRKKGFGQAWSDRTGAPGADNGCDTRNDILRRDLKDPKLDGGSKCTVTSGTLADPYTGKTIRFRRGAQSSAVQIDHIVALSDAWRTGARKLSQAEREALANDPLNLVAADGPANMGKGDKNAADWLPANQRYACDYVARQIAVKRQYKLWVTPAEHDSMSKVLKTCPARAVPTAKSPEVVLKH
ncbi:HNH endonuclease family protein [Streptomyces huiliensis]|uniref:HNH endonuclease family protein n=1 Tax=Streptomyces huiliensis TaxID=2876027 RepID=UPI001CBCBBF5|nr:HNH endonuclease family protein [Streptomyces huiliensis]MBZ4323078.1 HNH endonuclease family protein [Streptomyces huiliensis]